MQVTGALALLTLPKLVTCCHSCVKSGCRLVDGRSLQPCEHNRMKDVSVRWLALEAVRLLP